MLGPEGEAASRTSSEGGQFTPGNRYAMGLMISVLQLFSPPSVKPITWFPAIPYTCVPNSGRRRDQGPLGPCISAVLVLPESELKPR
ncbi:MAG: hypothetical protein MUF64_29870 [Polyangiaceae bacterium]|nr:hypothetical protein [Polyangiaceae bacterium]